MAVCQQAVSSGRQKTASSLLCALRLPLLHCCSLSSLSASLCASQLLSCSSLLFLSLYRHSFVRPTLPRPSFIAILSLLSPPILVLELLVILSRPLLPLPSHPPTVLIDPLDSSPSQRHRSYSFPAHSSLVPVWHSTHVGTAGVGRVPSRVRFLAHYGKVCSPWSTPSNMHPPTVCLGYTITSLYPKHLSLRGGVGRDPSCQRIWGFLSVINQSPHRLLRAPASSQTTLPAHFCSFPIPTLIWPAVINWSDISEA